MTVLRAAIITVGLMLASAAQAASDPIGYVRALYEREIARNKSADPMSPAEFDALFVPEVNRLREAPRAPDAPAVTGPKLHVFFGYGMLPGFPVTLRHVGGAGTADEAMVMVDLVVSAQKRSIFVHLRDEDGKWLISNIIYDRGDDMLTFFRRLSGQ